MERKIGEIFEYNGEWYQCIEGYYCIDCAFNSSGKCDKYSCIPDEREDNKDVIFKKLEKVGVPYHNSEKKLCQQYKCYINPLVTDEIVYVFADNRVVIEIKQNKEDMEEKKLNLKPFDLQKAREGKSVCTRDRRKARIICFDTKGDPCPIIALVEENGIEAAYHYDKNGQNAYNKSDLDLMMLHEKKSGWANIVIGSDGKPHMGRGIFQSKEAAEDAIKAFSSKLIDTIEIEWYE